MVHPILIPSGTIVQRHPDGKCVTLQGDVIVDAERVADGGYEYEVCGRRYYTCAGVVERLDYVPTTAGYRHRDGLVLMAGGI